MQDMDRLNTAAKRIVLMKAMVVPYPIEVDKGLKKWIAEINAKAREEKDAVQFKGHTGFTFDELLDYVTKWCIIEEGCVQIINPPPIRDDGVQMLFPENVRKVPSKYVA